MDRAVDAFSSIHGAVHGNGREVLERILHTCEEMLRDRGCTCVTRAQDVAACIGDTKAPVLRGRDEDGSCRVHVFLHGEDRVGIKYARQLLEDLDEEEEEPGVLAVVVSREGATPFTRKECDGRLVRFMLARDLYSNVTHHALVPKHEKVTTETTPYYSPSSLPHILDTDRIVQYYDWPVGTVVRVWRTFGGHEPIPYLRVVVAADR